MRPGHRGARPSSIAVIADDYTGAAEIGGVAVRYGLSAEVQIAWSADSGADVIAIDSDTRSLPAREAARTAGKLAQRIGTVPWVYKKIDSVLRGPVVAEIEAVIEALGMRRALLVPANPALGRVIREGCYFVDGKPIDKTDFAKDPEYPALFPDVRRILGSSEVAVLRPHDALPESGIILGEAASVDDLVAWAHRLDDATLPAGAAEFFARIIETRECRRVDQAVRPALQTRGNAVWVCGSASAQSRTVRQEFERRGIPILSVPHGLASGDAPPANLLQAWSDAAIQALESHRRAVLCMELPPPRNMKAPGSIINDLLCAAVHILGRMAVDHLYVEGGSTASALMRQLGWTRMRVDRELAPGVVSLEVPGERRRFLTVKPGSYPWPDAVWEL